MPFFSRRFWSITICSLALAACDSSAQFKSTDITGAPYGQSLELTDHTGKLRRLEDFRGKAVVLFFGFTHCPDICPTTLADILRPSGSSAGRGPRPDADGERRPGARHAESLAKYVTAFDPRFRGLRGDLAATKKVAAEFRSTSRSASPGQLQRRPQRAELCHRPAGALEAAGAHDRLRRTSRRTCARS